VQLVAHHGHIGALRGQLLFGLAQHGLAKAVVLTDEVHAFERFVLTHHFHERGHAHVGVGIKAEMPEAAFLVGEDGIYRRVIEEQHALARLALVVFVDGLDQHRCRGRRIALQDDLRAVIDGRAQRRQGLFVLALAVVALQRQRPRAASGCGQLHAAARIHALDGPEDVAKHRLARVGERAREAFDEGQFHGPRLGGRSGSAGGLCMGSRQRQQANGGSARQRAKAAP
jgi:hypothetical protein